MHVGHSVSDLRSDSLTAPDVQSLLTFLRMAKIYGEVKSVTFLIWGSGHFRAL
jgi:hypothetical protein